VPGPVSRLCHPVLCYPASCSASGRCAEGFIPDHPQLPSVARRLAEHTNTARRQLPRRPRLAEIEAANILGEPCEANYEAVPRVVFTDPQAGAAGATEARVSAAAQVSEVAKTATYTRHIRSRMGS
jgi:hypothetical protein